MNADKILTSDYNDNKVQYILDSKEYLSNILCNLIRKELKVKKSAVNISINYYDPTMYCPLASDNYLEFSSDSSYKEATEYSITVDIIDDCLSFNSLKRFINKLKSNLYKIGFSLNNLYYNDDPDQKYFRKISDSKSFKINCKYDNKEYDKLCYTIINMSRENKS